MSALISRGSLAYSCRMSVASAHTRRNVMKSWPGDTKGFVLIAASMRNGLRQIDRTDDVLLAAPRTLGDGRIGGDDGSAKIAGLAPRPARVAGMRYDSPRLGSWGARGSLARTMGDRAGLLALLP